ncbi:MAG: hypothetical protein M0R46_04125 [Candidatus Muirbacterium halophilum]|nr:hypothetical protein [Candidatus Muirbacterium halophilum]MCK9475080.1 hypothetical protein [Candidatus Muirbacterium halophilum]
MQDEAVLALLTSMDAILEGEFELRKGKWSKLYIELGKALQFPDISSDFGEQLSSKYYGKDATAIVSNSPSGIVLGQEIAKQLEIKHIYIEKDEKENPILKRGFELNSDDSVIIVDDVVSTGNSIKEMQSFLKKKNVEVKGICCVIDRAEKPLKTTPALKSLLALRLPVYASLAELKKD